MLHRPDIHIPDPDIQLPSSPEIDSLLFSSDEETGPPTFEQAHLAPFAVYEWSDMLCLDNHRFDPFFRCSCVQMDLTGIYAVTRQVLLKEKDTDLSSFPVWYQRACETNDSSMVTGLCFDRAPWPGVRQVDLSQYTEALDHESDASGSGGMSGHELEFTDSVLPDT